MLEKTIIRFFHFFGLFGKKAKIDKKLRKLAKSKPFYKIFWNLVCKCFPIKENSTKKLFFDFGICGPFFGQKTAKIDQKWRKLAKSKLFDKIFWNLVCKCFPTKENKTKKTFFNFWFFLALLAKKTAKINQKLRKLAKSKPFDEIF